MRHLVLLCTLLCGWTSIADLIPFRDFPERILRESNPFSFIKFNSAVDLAPEDFALTEAGLSGAWIPNSLQWVRVGVGVDEPGILAPRARFRLADGREREIALTQVESTVGLKFKPRASLRTHHYVDPSCSPYRVELTDAKIAHSWVMLSCHAIHNQGAQGTKPEVLVTVLWENEKEGTLRQIRLDAAHPRERLSAAGSAGGSEDTFTVEATLPERLHHLAIGAGLGPYQNRGSLRAFPTLYASYYFDDSFKLASFGAFPVRARPEIDWGLYLVLEQYRGFDQRISLNFLLGAHILSYHPSGAKRVYAFSPPQGVEMIFRDLFFKRMNFMIGGFFYPEISNRSYVNAWLRYGSSQFFVEFNYIDWEEPDPSFKSKSVGLSVGFPLVKLF